MKTYVGVGNIGYYIDDMFWPVRELAMALYLFVVSRNAECRN